MKVLGKRKIASKKRTRIVAVSGGADSVYLVKCFLRGSPGLLIAHFNHEARGKESAKDQKFVEELSDALGIPMVVGKSGPRAGGTSVSKEDSGTGWTGFERKARQERHNFLRGLKKEYDAEKILMGHTADDQVETVLMRFLEGGGITGLKGIPYSTEDGIERPLLQTWREDIFRVLRKNRISFQVDRSNFDTRFERNWVRHVLVPLLEKRYGKSVKKRIFLMGERFREMEACIQQTAYQWLGKNLTVPSGKGKTEAFRSTVGKKGLGEEGPGKIRGKSKAKSSTTMNSVRFPRKRYATLPSVVRIKILQILCFERIGTSPNERLLVSMDRMVVSGGPSASLNVGKGFTLRCRYGEAVLSPHGPGVTSDGEDVRRGLSGKGKGKKYRNGKREDGKPGGKANRREPVVRMEGPGRYMWRAADPGRKGSVSAYSHAFHWEERGRTAPGKVRLLSDGNHGGAFDGEEVRGPLSVRPLRTGDRIRPFGTGTEKKVKEILIDRKIPRDERWGRPVVCDSRGEILWIPGVIRSSGAPVTPKTRRTIVLRTEFAKKGKL